MTKQLQKQEKRTDKLLVPSSLVLAFAAFSFLPIFKSGGVMGLNFWQWIWNHTVFVGRPEYVPEEDYVKYFKDMYGE